MWIKVDGRVHRFIEFIAIGNFVTTGSLFTCVGQLSGCGVHAV